MLRKPPDLPCPFRRNALLDDPATEVGVDQPFLSAANGVAQIRIRNSLMVREAGEWLGLENAHPFPPPNHGTQVI